MIGAGSGITDFRKRGGGATPLDPTTVVYSGRYTGTGAALSITGVGFAPDAMWIKSEDSGGSTDGSVWDRVNVGAGVYYKVGVTAARVTDAQGVTSFDSDGFSLGTSAFVNTNARPYRFIAFKANTGFFGSAGYTGDGANRTITHNLTVAPAFYAAIVARGSVGGVIYNDQIPSPAGNYQRFNTTTITADATAWNNTAPTATVISLGTSTSTNDSGGLCILHSFYRATGVCAVGVYTGSGVNPKVITGLGFAPKSVIIMRSITTNSSHMAITGQTNMCLFGATTVPLAGCITLDADGFTITTALAALNSGSSSYYYIAFAN